jgi:hypothetical protein
VCGDFLEGKSLKIAEVLPWTSHMDANIHWFALDLEMVISIFGSNVSKSIRQEPLDILVHQNPNSLPKVVHHIDDQKHRRGIVQLLQIAQGGICNAH